MSAAACKVKIDNGILRSSALEIAALAENQGETFDAHFDGLTAEGQATVVALSAKCCEWAERIRKWAAEMRDVAQEVVGADGGYSDSGNRDD